MVSTASIFHHARDDAPAQMLSREAEAHALADRLPELVLEAARISSTVTHGSHGRRRAGPGETFWQFRQYQTGDAAHLVDWRRSASSDHLFIREREWEAAHTIWLWPDISPSMAYHSHLTPVCKSDRALVIMFAVAEMLVRSGERVAVMGLTQPSASRKVTTRIAELLSANLRQHGLTQSAPPPQRIGRFSSTVWVSDFLDPIDTIARRVEELAGNGSTGHLVQVLDPAEETLPFHGRTEFIGVEDASRWLTDRAEGLRERYRERLLAQRAALQDVCRRCGWSFLLHHTDRPAAETLLQLIMRLRGEPLSTSRETPAEERLAAGGRA